MYNDADVYLLDDPLAAVDADVAEHIWIHGIQNFLCKRRRPFTDDEQHATPHCCRPINHIDKHHLDHSATTAGKDAAEESYQDETSATIVDSGSLEEVRARGENPRACFTL